MLASAQTVSSAGTHVRGSEVYTHAPAALAMNSQAQRDATHSLHAPAEAQAAVSAAMSTEVIAAEEHAAARLVDEHRGDGAQRGDRQPDEGEGDAWRRPARALDLA